jgi:hypothetical protein
MQADQVGKAGGKAEHADLVARRAVAPDYLLRSETGVAGNRIQIGTELAAVANRQGVHRCWRGRRARELAFGMRQQPGLYPLAPAFILCASRFRSTCTASVANAGTISISHEGRCCSSTPAHSCTRALVAASMREPKRSRNASSPKGSSAKRVFICRAIVAVARCAPRARRLRMPMVRVPTRVRATQDHRETGQSHARATARPRCPMQPR